MDVFASFLEGIENLDHRERTRQVLAWVMDRFPNLVPVIKWNQPIFTDHGTYIMGFSVAKGHLAISPEQAGIRHFSKDIVEAGFEHTKMLMRVKWDQEMDYDLLERMLAYNMADKAACKTFWRK